MTRGKKAPTPAPGMWRGEERSGRLPGTPPRAGAPHSPPPAIEFPEESLEPRFDGKRGWGP